MATVTVRVDPNAAQDAASESSTDVSLSSTDSSSESSSSGSGSSGSSSGSGSGSSSLDASTEDDGAIDRDELLDNMDAARRRLDAAAEAILFWQERFLPDCVVATRTLDVLLAWNDALATLLRDARTGTPPEDRHDDDAIDDWAATAQEGDEDGDDAAQFARLNWLFARERPPGHVALNLDVALPPPDCATEYELALARARDHADAAAQTMALATAHDMLLECSATEDMLARSKMGADMDALRDLLGELQRAHDDTLASQREEHASMEAMVADAQAALPPAGLPSETARLATLLAMLAADLPAGAARQHMKLPLALWREEAAAPMSEQSLVRVISRVIAQTTPLDDATVRRLSAEARRAHANPQGALAALERSASALAAGRRVLPQLRALLDEVRGHAAERAQQTARIEADIAVVRATHREELRRLFEVFMATKERLLAATAAVVHQNQLQWQLAAARLHSECTHPSMEMALPFAEAAMDSAAHAAYTRLRAMSDRLLACRSAEQLERLVRYTMDQVPELQQLGAALAGIQDDLLSNERHPAGDQSTSSANVR